MNFQFDFGSLLFSLAIFFLLQDQFSGTHCFLKMSLITANVIYHSIPTETKSLVSSNASKEIKKKKSPCTYIPIGIK